MKKMYWRTHHMARSIMVLVCVFSLLAIMVVEYFKKSVPQKYYDQKLAAATLANQSFAAIKAYRIKKKIPIDAEADPQKSGLIGEAVTSVTSDQGSLLAKQTAINPNIAALVVDWLHQAGLKEGDTVAIGLTGSLPGLNIVVLSAVKVLGLKPIIIVSAASSQWGANLPGLSWLQMQKVLYDQGLIPYMPSAASLGGIDDRVRGMNKRGQDQLKKVITDLDIPFIDSKDASDGVERRMSIYAESHTPVKAYINIGGGTASIGKIHKIRKSTHKVMDGLNQTLPLAMLEYDSVMVRFLKMGIPVINLASMSKIAYQYGFPVGPTKPPQLGQGPAFFKAEYNPWLAAGALIAILIFLTVVSIMGRKLSYKRLDQSMEIL